MAEKLNRVESTKSLPGSVNEYIETHQLERIVNRALNDVLRQRPIDPLSTIATLLLNQASNSIPVFDRIIARKTFLMENPLFQTLKLQVYMNYQGRSELRYTHIMSYDPEEQDKFIYDNKAEKTGLEYACDLINSELNLVIAGTVVQTINI